MSMNDIKLVLHADWSINPKKRVLSCAYLQQNGCYRVYAPSTVGDPFSLLSWVKNQIGENSCAVMGFDFPIGIPEVYAYKCGIEDFLGTLPLFGKDVWKEFYNVAEKPDEISLYRPFYPNKPGNSRYSHLINAIGVNLIEDLRRICERRTSTRRAASPLFWTLGPQQVGKAAIIGWRDVLTSALRDPLINLSIWPF